MEYRFTLKDNNEKAFRVFVWFLFFLHLIIAAVLGLSSESTSVKISMYILLGFYAVIGTGFMLLKKSTRSMQTFSLVLALFYGHFWLQQLGIIALLAFIVLYVFVMLVQGKTTTVQISEKGASVTRLFRTMLYEWPQVEHVILKDDILTVDLKSNKFIQAEIAPDGNLVEEKEFNRFCSEQLSGKNAESNQTGDQVFGP